HTGAVVRGGHGETDRGAADTRVVAHRDVGRHGERGLLGVVDGHREGAVRGAARVRRGRRDGGRTDRERGARRRRERDRRGRGARRGGGVGDIGARAQPGRVGEGDVRRAGDGGALIDRQGRVRSGGVAGGGRGPHVE